MTEIEELHCQLALDIAAETPESLAISTREINSTTRYQ